MKKIETETITLWSNQCINSHLLSLRLKLWKLCVSILHNLNVICYFDVIVFYMIVDDFAMNVIWLWMHIISPPFMFILILSLFALTLAFIESMYS